MPKSQRFILDRMRICGHILCERSFSAMLICWKKAGWVLKLELLSTVGDISGSIGPNKSLKTGKFSLAQASVKWKFVTDAPDIFRLGLVFTRADNNLFVTQLIIREINSSRHHLPLCGTLNTIKFIWEVETHVGENSFQFNYQ